MDKSEELEHKIAEAAERHAEEEWDGTAVLSRSKINSFKAGVSFGYEMAKVQSAEREARLVEALRFYSRLDTNAFIAKETLTALGYEASND